MSSKKKQSKVDDQIKKMTRFTVKVSKAEFLKKELKSTYPKWKLMLCKWMDIAVADSYDWCYRVAYSSNLGTLKSGDVLVNSQGRAFGVIKEQSRVAVLVTPRPSVEQPLMFGTFRVLIKPKNKNS